MSQRPSNVGIKAIEIYFPTRCVDQAELEKFDGVSTGKYTIGLGQTKMSFCDDREDIYSLALTTLSSLLTKYNIDRTSIGRLEVGTETLLDKSKSVKSVLMQLFAPVGNNNIEGADTVNACYGGTNALFNAVNWVESSGWDGRDAIVVCGDIALYKKGAARPTGGAGCVAMLIGPDAPLVLEPGLRATYAAHTYDFYKPDLTSEYPYVDGHYSIKCYLEAVDNCYRSYNKREAAIAAGKSVSGQPASPATPTTGSSQTSPLDRFDYMAFHAPTCKLVAKSYARLLYNDYLADPTHPAFASVPAELATVEPAASYSDRTIEKTFMQLTSSRFGSRVKRSTYVPTMCGNMYSASIYSALVGLVGMTPPAELEGKRIGMFSFGSGLISSFFSIRVAAGSADRLAAIQAHLDIDNRLNSRDVVPPEQYDQMCLLREKAHLKSPFEPTGTTDRMAPGTYYLSNIDDMFRRDYLVKSD